MDERWPKTVPLSLQATVRRAVEAPEATLLLPAAPVGLTMHAKS